MNKAIIAHILFGLLIISMACFGMDQKPNQTIIPEVWTVNDKGKRVSLKLSLRTPLDHASDSACVLYIPNKSSASAIARLHLLDNLPTSISADFFSEAAILLNTAKELNRRGQSVYAAFPTEIDDDCCFSFPPAPVIYNLQEIIDERAPINEYRSLHAQQLKNALIKQSTSIKNFTSILEQFLGDEIKSFMNVDTEGSATPLPNSKQGLLENNPYFMKILSEIKPQIIASLKQKKANPLEKMEILEQKN